MSQHTTPCRGPNAAQYADLKRNSHTYLADNTSPDETTGKRNTVATTEEDANRTSRQGALRAMRDDGWRGRDGRREETEAGHVRVVVADQVFSNRSVYGRESINAE